MIKGQPYRKGAGYNSYGRTDQASVYARDFRNYHVDEELQDIIEDISGHNEFTKKDFNFDSYLNSKIDY